MNRRVFLLSLLTPSVVRAGVVYHGTDLVIKEELPEVWYWSHPGCPPCARFIKEYEENKDGCGFLAVKQDGDRPTWIPDSDPQFWWHTTKKIPSQEDVNNTRHQDGYPGWKSFIEKWKHSRDPKKSKPAGGPAKRALPTVQPDQPVIRAVARDVIAYNPSHRCQNCGRNQFNIENGSGPNHTHRCQCGTAWWHRDAN